MPSPTSSASAASRPSRSAIVGRKTMIGHHLLDIEAYSHMKEHPTSECIKSTPFSVGGCSWRIHYYPNGSESDGAEFISVFIYLEQHQYVSEPIKAQVKFSLLDLSGEPVPSHAGITTLRDFTGGHGYGFSKFIKRAWLEKSTCLKNDRFTIRCDILVCKKTIHTEKRKVAYLRLRFHLVLWCHLLIYTVSLGISSWPKRAPMSRSKLQGRHSRRTGASLR
ncbi:unnamed protein product [Urochloa humidicola]